MFASFPKKWVMGIVSGVVGISILGGSALLAQAAGHDSMTKPVTQPAATKPAVKQPGKPVITPVTAQFLPADSVQGEQCGFCKMTVHPKTEELGQFAAQVLTDDGKTVFLDDIGCMMNFKRTQSKPAKAIWVRDYYTKEWILASKAVLVSASIDTPMNYGYVMFKDEASATKFISENKALHAAKTTWQIIDADAKDRMMKKAHSMSHDMNHTTPTNHH